MADKSKTTVIVKKIKKGHGGHHGGSWKVAYADFVTAMMAFFLLLWLITMVEPEKRAAIADYFRNFNLFQQSGRSFMEQSSSIHKEVKTTVEPVTGENQAERLSEQLKQAIEQKLKELKDHIMIETVEGGVRIQIIDLEGDPMFPLSSSAPTDKAKQILKVVAENIKDENARIAVEGHTDAVPFRGGKTTNWELSTERASSARRELEQNGVDPAKIARVVGYADTMPLIKDDPKDPRNRRISIILMFEKGQKPSQINFLQEKQG
ncbi:MAG: flagellar motor protein MotB [Thermodesulfovibrio sp.]|uniref:flagellar motor protein MotB n=1 Tax=unclassified Thermodesulfovibrio TaxID=2645936 RepID=UPI00083AFF68|nr:MULTISPECIES: flagellar motor protein MotB [unclassified Thermodesulfovibrio]MDI1472873.1 flagellar motor protein MotB [Thermodesulfovibrio sp. 1176]MDI6714886.1 flagellar motor protein MotB [Thermodesulfovibrio sp.]ODA44530.1 Flagellar motor rotation protein MotB [Thermodesulfovibrio sp. N1]